jgi:hypothetical protein
MSEPALVGELLPGVLQEVIDRAGPGYERWAEQVAATGYCTHPVRLRGRVEHADAFTGEVRTVYSTEREPDATLLKACGNRRASVCRSCSATYQGDSFQLLAAGLRGGKGVPETVTALLERAVRQAAATVAVPCPVVDDDQAVTLVARWGEQLDVRHISEAGDTDDQELSAEQVAGYVAKYATKSTEALGVTLDHRIGEVELEGLDVPAHVAELVRACWELGGRPSLAGLRLRAWAHMLGFGGHFSTKSRRYSTTLGALRRARVAFAIRRRRGGNLPLDAWGRPEDDPAVLVVASWHYLGSGYQSTGEAWLAASAAARAREARRIAKEELRTMTMTAV